MAKLEAHLGRGGSDLRQSHDFEDIIYLLDNCSKLFEIVSGAEETVRIYLSKQCGLLIENSNLIEGIECALPIGSDSESTEIISDLLISITDLQ